MKFSFSLGEFPTPDLRLTVYIMCVYRYYNVKMSNFVIYLWQLLIRLYFCIQNVHPGLRLIKNRKRFMEIDFVVYLSYVYCGNWTYKEEIPVPTHTYVRCRAYKFFLVVGGVWFLRILTLYYNGIGFCIRSSGMWKNELVRLHRILKIRFWHIYCGPF